MNYLDDCLYIDMLHPSFKLRSTCADAAGTAEHCYRSPGAQDSVAFLRHFMLSLTTILMSLDARSVSAYVVVLNALACGYDALELMDSPQC